MGVRGFNKYGNSSWRRQDRKIRDACNLAMRICNKHDELRKQFMEKSEKIGTLAAALVAAQPKIEGATKDKENPAFRGAKYADLASVMDACKDALNEQGITVVQSPQPSDVGKLSLETVLLHKSGEWISGTITMPLAKNDPQGYGSALTYARRYGLAAMVGVCPEDDDGNAASGKTPTPHRASTLARPATKPTSPPPANMNPQTGEIPPAVAQLAEYGEIIVDENFERAYVEEMKKRNFTMPAQDAVLAAMCKKDKVKTIFDLPLERRHAFIDGIRSGKLDSFNKPAKAA